MLKKYLLIFSLVVSHLLMGSAYAENVPAVAKAPTQAVGAMHTLSSLDMQAAFQSDGQAMNLATLSSEEMLETQGAGYWTPRQWLTAVVVVAAAVTCAATVGSFTYGIASIGCVGIF